MPGVGRAPTPRPQNAEELTEGKLVNLVSKEELEQEVYSKKAIDEAMSQMMTAFKKLQEENEEIKNQVEKINIKIIHTNPLKKFLNLFRGD